MRDKPASVQQPGCCFGHLNSAMREQKLLLVGLATMCVVSAASLARFIVVLRIFRQQRLSGMFWYNGGGDANSNLTAVGTSAPSRILLPSLVFHTLVFLCLAAEVPIYVCRFASTLGNDDDASAGSFCKVGRPLYALHLSSYLLLFAAFCVIVTLWSDVAVFEPNEWTVCMNRSMFALCLCYLLVTVSAVSVCLGLGNVKYFFSSYAFLIFCAYSIAALMLLGCCFLVLGCLMQRRICRVLVTGSCTPRITARVVRLNVVMLACFVCFTMRALMLAALVEVQARGEMDRNYGRGWKKWEWDLRLEWAPHVIPCVAMLYLMRNSGRPSAGGGEDDGHSDERAELGQGKADSSAADVKDTRRNYGSYDYNTVPS